MIDLRLADVAAATGGRCSAGAAPDAVVSGVAIDSRAVGPGHLFVALAGERTDGHEYAAAACAAGAVAVLAGRDVGVPAVIVDDPLVALGRLSGHVRGLAPHLTVVGVTGSSGKTSTKDLLRGLLARLGPTVAPRGSYNNDIGLPLTLLEVAEQTRYLVAEMGARGGGHIARLCALARPEVGLVLNVGSSHLGEFGSRTAIAAAKGELVESLPDTGTAVLNADDPKVAAMAARTRATVVTFGHSSRVSVRAESVRVDTGGRARFLLRDVAGGGEAAPVALGLVGEHQVDNALAAAAVALHLGLPLPDVAAGLAAARPESRWRMEVTAAGPATGGVTVINDAYNANPESVRAALKTLRTLSEQRGRSVAVLGEMAELGPDSAEEHERVGRLAVRLGVSQLIAVGSADGPVGRLHAGAVLEGSWAGEAVRVDDAAAALELLRTQLRPGDVVLVKASRAVGLERVALALATDGANQ